MRGTKLTAWRTPPIWSELRNGLTTDAPAGSTVPQKQRRLFAATEAALAAVAADVQIGLRETVGVESFFSLDDSADARCSMILELPENADAELIARAIDLENVEAWLDADNKVRVGISPWFSTKDVDQTVLSTVKVIHVLLGLHAADAAAAKPKSLGQKLLAAVTEIMQIQKEAGKNNSPN